MRRSTSTTPHPAEHRVAIQILDLVEIEAPRDEALQRRPVDSADEPFDARRGVRRDLVQDRRQRGLAQEPTGQRFVVVGEVFRTQLLERVRVRVVPDVVQERGVGNEFPVDRIHGVQLSPFGKEPQRESRQVIDA
jgi:hypothetical protein